MAHEGVGFHIAMAGLDGGRLNIAACSLGGAADGARQGAGLYGASARRSARQLHEFQALQFRLADMETELAGVAQSSSMARPRARSTPRRPTPPRSAPWPSASSPTAGFTIANDALQLLGGYGYLHDYGVEKLVRDLRVHQILEGTNEIMRVIVARHLIESKS